MLYVVFQTIREKVKQRFRRTRQRETVETH
jgi:hypothetical protein